MVLTIGFEEKEVIPGFRCRIGEEVIVMSFRQVQAVEEILEAWRVTAHPSRPNFASGAWGVPSALVRVDMPPVSHDGRASLYEIECAPAGLGITAVTGAMDVFRGIVAAWKLGGVDSISWAVAPSRANWEWELALGVRHLEEAGLEVKKGLHGDEPLLLRSDGSDPNMPWQRCLCDHGAGGGDKGALPQFGVRLLRNVSDPFAEFPDGFTLKPRCGAGARDVHIFAASQPFKREGATATSVRKKLAEVERDPDEWVIQPFLPPEVVGKLFRIWRVMAAWDASIGRYRVVGGTWNARKSLRIHGAKDTVMGAIEVAK